MTLGIIFENPSVIFKPTAQKISNNPATNKLNQYKISPRKKIFSNKKPPHNSYEKILTFYWQIVTIYFLSSSFVAFYPLANGGKVYRCPLCGYKYHGDINFEYDDYVCPICGQHKSMFELL